MIKGKMKKTISKLSIIALLISSVGIGFSTKEAKAGLTDSSLFEPAVGCVAGGTAGYFTSPAGQEVLMMAVFCGGGALIGVLLNMHYSSKYDRVYRQDLAEMRRSVKEMELQQAMRSANGEDENFSLRVRKVVPGQKLPNGSVTAPTIVESLVTPGETVRVGD